MEVAEDEKESVEDREVGQAEDKEEAVGDKEGQRERGRGQRRGSRGQNGRAGASTKRRR